MKSKGPGGSKVPKRPNFMRATRIPCHSSKWLGQFSGYFHVFSQQNDAAISGDFLFLVFFASFFRDYIYMCIVPICFWRPQVTPEIVFLATCVSFIKVPSPTFGTVKTEHVCVQPSNPFRYTQTMEPRQGPPFHDICVSFSPPVRWGLLDFMSALSSSSSSSALSSAFAFSFSFSFSFVSSCDDVWSVFRAGPQPRSCEASVPHRTSTAILWVQCPAPDLNREPVRPVFRAGPQPRSCEASVPRGTSTAILWGQCSAPDLSREMCQKEECQKDCQKLCQTECRRSVRKNVRQNVRKNVRQLLQKICQKESWHSARWYTDMFWHVCCLPLHNVSWRGCVWMIFCTVLRERCQVLYWVADRTRQDHAKIQKNGWRVCLFWNASPWIKSRWQPSPDNHHPTCHGVDHSK